MIFIDSANKAVDKFGAGKHGFQAGNPTTGVQPTAFTAEWCDNVQQELVNAIEGSGASINPASKTQLLTAIQTLINAKAVPAGAVQHFAMAAAPTGWIKANGAAVSRSTYAALFSAIGTTFGAGDGTTTFNVPDLRAEFIRGLDDLRGVDANRTLGSAQIDAFQGHHHSFSSGQNTTSGTATSGYLTDVTSTVTSTYAKAGSPLADGVNGAPRTAQETRPRNIALLACIKI